MPKKIRTQKQKKLVKAISENLGVVGTTKTLTQLMKDAGYTDSTAKQQTMIMDTIREDLDPIIAKMVAERDAAIERMSKVRDKAKYRDLTDAIDKLTKNVQLLSGKETERTVEQVQVYIPKR